MRIGQSAKAFLALLRGSRSAATAKSRAPGFVLPGEAIVLPGEGGTENTAGFAEEHAVEITLEDCQTCRFWDEHQSAVRADGKLVSVCFCGSAASAGHFTVGTDSCPCWEIDKPDDRRVQLNHKTRRGFGDGFS